MKVISLFAACWVAGVLAGCSKEPGSHGTAGSGVGALSLAKVVVALKPDKDPDAMLEEKKTLESFLSDRLGRPVEVIIPLSASVILEGFQNGTIDLGYLSATEMITARDKGTASVLLAGEIEGKTSYQSYWVALTEKPYQGIRDLKGKPVAFASKTSTSGGVVPHWALIKSGLLREKGEPEEFFGRGNIWYGSGYVSAIEQVLNGSAEAAAVSYYVIDKDKHLSAEQRARLRKIEEQGPVPTHVIAVRTSVSDVDRALLQGALEGLNEGPHQGLRDKVFTSRLVTVDEAAHLAPLREALILTGRLQK